MKFNAALLPLLAITGSALACEQKCGGTAHGGKAVQKCHSVCDNHFTEVPKQVYCKSQCDDYLKSHDCKIPHRRDEKAVTHELTPEEWAEVEQTAQAAYEDALWRDEEAHSDDEKRDIEARDLSSCLKGCKTILENAGRLCPISSITVGLAAAK